MSSSDNTLKLKRVNIDTQIEHVVYMLRDCSVYKAEGFESLSRVQVELNGKRLIASLNIIENTLLQPGEAGLSEGAWKLLEANEGDLAHFSHPHPVLSMEHVRAKMFGKELSQTDFFEILTDVISGSFSNVETAAFITACAAEHLSLKEIIGLTQAMVSTGQELHWNKVIVADKHCVGGLPGNRTTPIVVAIVASLGITIPKTSSRAITSPAGTADTMETLTKVDVSLDEIRKVVLQENGCFAWGGSVRLSPADDILIRVERALDIDSDGQMIASVLSKKKAAGSTHVLIDIPIGKTAKVRSLASAEKLKYYFTVVSEALGLKTKVLFTDGQQPVGFGIGPALEALDVLSVLKNELSAPSDLKERALLLAGALLELCDHCKANEGAKIALEELESGRAYQKFLSICKAQGELKIPVVAKHSHAVYSSKTGVVTEIDNRKLSRAAKLAGAPQEPGAGIRLAVKLGQVVHLNDLLFDIYSEAEGELNYTLDYLKQQSDLIIIST
jgi:thymidine phosphorylase